VGVVPLYNGDGDFMIMHEKTAQALRLVAAGMTPYRAAQLMGIALSTIYRAIKRANKK
jgi:DNA-binding CsgD family transcriptional regulator